LIIVDTDGTLTDLWFLASFKLSVLDFITGSVTFAVDVK